jgi:hypothetical protein
VFGVSLIAGLALILGGFPLTGYCISIVSAFLIGKYVNN